MFETQPQRLRPNHLERLSPRRPLSISCHVSPQKAHNARYTDERPIPSALAMAVASVDCQPHGTGCGDGTGTDDTASTFGAGLCGLCCWPGSDGSWRGNAF
jgi:hypothetical protein